MEKGEHTRAPCSATEKGLLEPSSGSSSLSNYPPSPGYVSDEPVWAQQKGGRPSLRQRVSDLFESSALTSKTHGYLPVDGPSFSNKIGHHLPMYNLVTPRSLKELVQNANHKKFRRLASIVLLVCAAMALFCSTPSSGPEPFRAGVEAKSKDSRCANVLQGGSDAIVCHIELAQRKFETMMTRQSKTYAQAYDRYLEHYNRRPPPGFDEWFRFAKEKNATIIDEFGQLEQDLAPLRKVPDYVLRQRIENALKSMPSLYRYDFAHGNVTTTAPNDAEDVQSYHEILSPILHKLPQLSVLHNFDAAHRVCGPKDSVENIHSTDVMQVGTTGRPNSYNYLIQGCPRNTATRSPMTSDRPTIDVCNYGKNWVSQHGLLHVPGSCFNTDVPILSFSKASSFQDITTTSWYYASPNYRLLNPDQKDKVPYADKKPHIYWRGQSTGSFSEKDVAFFGHRQRLIMLAQQMRVKAAQLAASFATSGSGESVLSGNAHKRLELPNMPEAFTSAQLLALSRLSADTFDMNFVGLVNCDGQDTFCEGWTEQFPLAQREQTSVAFQNKFVMDLDGHGVSGSFYRLLDSNSLVFKQTVYAEWHDDRIIPWLHYVPVSMSMEELPILIDFFTNHPRGIELGEKMANASSEWASKTLRKIDMSVYTYRQMLELAHIVGHD